MEKPYQGANPKSADLVFIGLDANYASNIGELPIFEEILEYHRDGPGFWRKHGVHHPFLLPTYDGAGRKYHSNFSQVGLGPEYADRVSFVELVSVPTTGRSSLTLQDLDPAHLSFLRNAIFESGAKSIFVSPAVIFLMNKNGAFPLLRLHADAGQELPIFYNKNATTVYKHLHFSVYGKFESQRRLEAKAINLLASRV